RRLRRLPHPTIVPFNPPPPTHIYTLSLHDALPIWMKMLTMTNLSTECLIQLTKLGYDATPFNQILKQNAKREMRLRLGKVTVGDVLEAQPVTTNLLKFMRASIKMIGVSNLQSFIASRTQKLTLSDISDESKNYLDKAGITTACLRIKSKWTAGGK